MYHKCYWLIWLTAFLLLLGMTIVAEDESNNNVRVINPAVAHSIYYAIPNEHNFIITEESENPRSSLGIINSTARGPGPGITVASTWYDYQHNGSMGRMIDWSYDVPNGLIIHFSWMNLPAAAPPWINRRMGYNSYMALSGSFLGGVLLGDYAGYVNLGTTRDNRAIVGGHNDDGADYGGKIYFQNNPGSTNFDTSLAVPPELANSQDALWPRFQYIEGPNDTILHVLAKLTTAEAGDPSGIYYFRRVGGKEFGVWDSPPFIVDTNYNIAYDIDANYEGKVALVWPANLPCDISEPNASADEISCVGYYRVSQWDNDIYYQISNNHGASWQPRVNVTNYISTEGVSDSYRAYNNLSTLLDSDGNLHIVWDGSFWPADAYSGGTTGVFRGKIFHWSENQPFIVTAHNSDWSQTHCNGGVWQLNSTKMSISECDGRLYMLFVQFNDIPGGIEDDCATSSNPGYPTGAANGDLWITVSENGGYTWTNAVNLTNTYSPGCDSLNGSGGPCASEVWPSMAKYGTFFTGNFSGIPILGPNDYTGDYYLDVQYIDDPSAGGVIQNEGTWQQADVKWFRLACSENFGPRGVCCNMLTGNCRETFLDDCNGFFENFISDEELSCTPNPCKIPPGPSSAPYPVGISIDGVAGPGADSNADKVVCDSDFVFLIRIDLTDLSALGWSSLMSGSSGFKVYSPEGASWTPITYDTAGGIGDYMDVVVATPYGVDGTNDDTLGFGYVAFFSGFPNGYDDVVLGIKTKVDCSDTGKTICIDSSFFPPANTWLWQGNAGQLATPTWEGPYCFSISTSGCCNHDGIRGDVTGVPSIFVDDLTFLVDYLFKSGPGPDCFDEGDANGDGQLLVDDLVLLVDYLFKGGPPPADCP